MINSDSKIDFYVKRISPIHTIPPYLEEVVEGQVLTSIWDIGAGLRLTMFFGWRLHSVVVAFCCSSIL